jgi:hypothetical protein
VSISTSLAGVRLEDFLKRMAKLSDFPGDSEEGNCEAAGNVWNLWPATRLRQCSEPEEYVSFL